MALLAHQWTTVNARLHSDRKSTRLNSSHLGISYAVFCLKKKKKKNRISHTIPSDDSMVLPSGLCKLHLESIAHTHDTNIRSEVDSTHVGKVQPRHITKH